MFYPQKWKRRGPTFFAVVLFGFFPPNSIQLEHADSTQNTKGRERVRENKGEDNIKKRWPLSILPLRQQNCPCLLKISTNSSSAALFEPPLIHVVWYLWFFSTCDISFFKCIVHTTSSKKTKVFVALRVQVCQLLFWTDLTPGTASALTSEDGLTWSSPQAAWLTMLTFSCGRNLPTGTLATHFTDSLAEVQQHVFSRLVINSWPVLTWSVKSLLWNVLSKALAQVILMHGM